jgi:stage II sporulation protein D
MNNPQIYSGIQYERYSGKLTLFTNAQPSANRSKAAVCTLFPGTSIEFRIFKTGIVLLLLIILVGCKARRLVKPTPQMEIEPQFQIRVLVLDDVSGCKLNISSPFSIGTTDNPMAAKEHFDQFNTVLNVSIKGGSITIGSQQFPGNKVIVSPNEPYIFNLNGDDYRGQLEIITNSDGNSFDVVNPVPLEPYLAGVVGAEMPKYWEPEALKAQTIASRTYCLYIKKRFGDNRSWDVKKSQANQVYLGIKAESAQVWDAVNKTYGQVLVCKEYSGSEEIFPAYYSSVCGGHTEDSRGVFGDSFDTLTGVSCPYCKDVAKPGSYFWPTAQFDKTYVTERLQTRYPKLRQLGKITNIKAERKSDYQGLYGKYSRLTLVKLSGSNGNSDFLRGEDFRLSIDPSGLKIRSAIFEIVNYNDKWAFMSGRGFGHGVGMCQCGAQGMARAGKKAEEILGFYYRGSKIVRVY